MNKEINFILEEKDFKKNSGISKQTFNNLFESFKNYLKILDTDELTEKDEKGNLWTIDTLIKAEKKKINFCRDIIKGEMALVDNSGNMSSLNSTEKIIVRLINPVKLIIFIRKKITELEKPKNESKN